MTRLAIKYNREYRDLPIEDIKHEFVKNSFLFNWYKLKPGLTIAESVKRMSHFLNEKVRYYFEMRSRGEEGWQALKELTTHPDESAQLSAAMFYRYKDYDYALAIIEKMGKTPNFWAPRTVRREVAYQASIYFRDLKRQEAGLMAPYPDIYQSWLKDLEVEKQGKSPKVKYQEAVVPYKGEYASLSLEQLRQKFIQEAERIPAAKVDSELSLGDELDIAKDANRELFKIYFELRERGEEGVNLLKAIATVGSLPAQMQAGRLLQWVDTQLACDTLTSVADTLDNCKQDTIEYETANDAMTECVVLSPVLEGTSYGTRDPYEDWKEWRATNKK